MLGLQVAGMDAGAWLAITIALVIGMALTQTTLNGALTALANVIRVTSATGFAAGQYAKIDSEFVRILAQLPDASTMFYVMRGQLGTKAVAHTTGAPIQTSSSNRDFAPLQAPALYSYGAAGALQVAPGVHELATGAASAMTLALPATDQDGMTLDIVARTAHAYTVTVPTAFQGADTGTVATFGGAIGDQFRIIAQNGRWTVASVANVAIA